jgi:hypothetical protein
MLISIESGYAQEVDKSRSNKKKIRETKFKTKNKQGDRIHKGDITGRKNKKIKKSKRRGNVTSPASTPYGNALYQFKDRRKEGENVQPSTGSFNTPSKSTENHRKGDISGRKNRKTVSRSGESKAVQPSGNPYAGRKQRTEGQRAKVSRAQGGGFQSISQAGEDKPRKRRRIQPRTASRAFIARKKVNVYAGRPRRGEKAKTKDIAGRKIRAKNFKSRSQPIIQPSFNPYFSRKGKADRAKTALRGSGYASASKKGERKYEGQAAGGHASATRKGENAWRKDITGRDFRKPRDPGVVTGKKGLSYTGTQNRNLSISGGLKNNGRKSISTSGGGGSISSQLKKGRVSALPRKSLGDPQVAGFSGRFNRFEISPGFDTRSAKFQGSAKGTRKPLKGGGSISNSIWKGRGQAMPREDMGNSKIRRFAGNVKGSRKPFKGGGSISNNIWQGKGQVMPRKDLGSPQVSGFTGNVKGSRKPFKGGGSISNNIWQGKGQAMPRKDLGSPQISGFAGNVKGSRKPFKGGGSISKSGWNNSGQALPRNSSLQNSSTISQGNYKGSRKPIKGGGSISKTGWNNNRQALPRNSSLQKNLTLSQGNYKGSRKPFKGGGSISKSGWNNNRTPLQKKSLSVQNFYTSKFKGRFNRFEISPGYANDNIGNFKGNIKGESKKIGQPEGTQFKGRFTQFELSPGFLGEDIGAYRGTLKMKSKYRKKPHAVEQALKAKEPHKNMFLMNGYQGKMKDKRNFQKKPHAHKDAQKGIAPTKSASKAIAFQGNFKLKKNYDRNMHPSSKYTTSLQPRNSLEEKDRLFKFNIWWAKLFKKNENQPTAVKDKIRNPRYDKREKDLWYD